MNDDSKINPRIIVALDYPQAAPALALAQRLEPALCRLKVGKELFTAAGPQLVEQLQQRGFEIFLDLKFHDIPNTTAQACKAAAAMGVWMVNVHALGGKRMMEAAREALANVGQRPMLIAVTVLTSMAQEDLHGIGINASPAQMVPLLAGLANDSGLDGVVCSAQEAFVLRQQLGRDFCLVTPGIRPANASADDQARIMTPRAALENGANYLVIGRPITQASDPLLALQDILKETGDMA
ncbi:orotidine-5'-phosphate decarboxylase [Sideroxydans lithotrophicus]|uniref:Orotidine 5'-phosphate decarboxylase n=1 Tax=Sideroxydans lithotrophicus (strain ES-1) TaxID=580332 RepID=D5CTX2_SIDLE|nr:orotidine-5'-phosphate decarboxylase [Sideroxydans lithotrophicus]ADE12284.1 orotidine 5'-phosphate decarboxylase [Sideroxydans lithotrophicus ES-1]